MMCRDQGRLEHHVPQGTATTGDGPFPAKCSAVMRDRGQSGECGSFFAGDGADLRHFGDQLAPRVVPSRDRKDAPRVFNLAEDVVRTGCPPPWREACYGCLGTAYQL